MLHVFICKFFKLLQWCVCVCVHVRVSVCHHYLITSIDRMSKEQHKQCQSLSFHGEVNIRLKSCVK